jgi:hypothetical protein
MKHTSLAIDGEVPFGLAGGLPAALTFDAERDVIHSVGALEEAWHSGSLLYLLAEVLAGANRGRKLTRLVTKSLQSEANTQTNL